MHRPIQGYFKLILVLNGKTWILTTGNKSKLSTRNMELSISDETKPRRARIRN
jgi:hypothetical protein